MTEIHATRDWIERRLAATLDALRQRDARIADTILRVSGDRALQRAVEEDQRGANTPTSSMCLRRSGSFGRDRRAEPPRRAPPTGN